MSEHVVGAGSGPRDALASLHEFQQLSAGTTYADAVHRLLAAVRTQLDMQPAALRARPAAPDGVTVARLAAVDDARVGVPAERQRTVSASRPGVSASTGVEHRLHTMWRTTSV
jgi:hypothetical protein